MSARRTAIERFDDGLFRVERVVVAAMLALMGTVVFLDVMHRVSTRTGSLLAAWWFVGPVAAGVGALALRTRGRPNAIVEGIGVGVAVAAAQVAFVSLMPNGLVWSQTLALSLTLWLGTIGASLAAHERRHLALDVGTKVWPKAMVPYVAALGHVVTAAFCVLVLWLGWRSVAAHWDLWSSTDGAAGNLSGLPIPKWFAALSIPYGMAALTLRFGLDAWRTLTGRLDPEADDTLAQLGISRSDTPAGEEA